jgi:nicotinamidase-related amidase
MTARGLLSAESCALVVVDMQERLAPAIADIDDITQGARALLEAAAALGVPAAFTEQYPRGLGPTLPALRALAPDAPVFEKTGFDAAAEPGENAGLWARGSSRRTVLLCGTEAHVCVLQTAFGLAAQGQDVAVVADATGARRPQDRALALERLARAGIGILSTEMVLFEWLGEAGTPEFQALRGTIKALGARKGPT